MNALAAFQLATLFVVLLASHGACQQVGNGSDQEFVDPRNGLKYRMREIKVTQLVPSWETSTQPVTQTYYQPIQQYRLQSRWIGRWNPFATPYQVYEWQPYTYWEPKSVELSQQVVVPKWTPREQSVMVPEYLVATNSPAGSGTITPSSVAQTANPPSQSSANVADNQDYRGTLSRTTANQAANNRNLASSNSSAQSRYPLVPIGVQTPHRQPGIYPASGIAYQTAPVPVYNQPLLPNMQLPGRPIANAVNQINRTFTGMVRPSSIPPTSNLPQVASRPEGSGYRDAVQSGMNATVLR